MHSFLCIGPRDFRSDGAILKQYTNFKFLEFSIITTVGCLFCGIIFDYWIIGLILIGIGTAGIFPMVHEYVRTRVSNDDINFRERNRFNGRIVGAICFSSICCINQFHYCIWSVLVSTYLIWTMTSSNLFTFDYYYVTRLKKILPNRTRRRFGGENFEINS